MIDKNSTCILFGRVIKIKLEGGRILLAITGGEGVLYYINVPTRLSKIMRISDEIMVICKPDSKPFNLFRDKTATSFEAEDIQLIENEEACKESIINMIKNFS